MVLRTRDYVSALCLGRIRLLSRYSITPHGWNCHFFGTGEPIPAKKSHLSRWRSSRGNEGCETRGGQDPLIRRRINVESERLSDFEEVVP